mmetsp:Transcript_14840/g.35958  ORF Transcript_14840/g.35958 Transcript_14840/m.35958 type:complete len:553 (-) Transcript_14840:1626-3284(-)
MVRRALCLGFILFLGSLGLFIGRFLGSGFLIDRKSSVLREFTDLGLQPFHVIRKLIDGIVALFAGNQALSALLGSTLILAVVSSVDNGKAQDDNNDGTKSGKSRVSIREEVRDTQEDQWHCNECNSNVDQWESTEETGRASKSTGGIQRNVAHERNWVPDSDTGNVEEQVGKSDLHAVGVSKKSSQKTSDSGTNIGSKSQRKHLFKTKGTDTDQRSQDRGGDGRRLDQNGDTSSDENGNVSVNVGGLVKNTCGSTHHHALQDLDQSEKADEKKDQTNDERADSRGTVNRFSGFGVEKGRAVWGVSLLVTRHESGLAGKRIRVILAGKSSVVGVVGIASGLSRGDFFGNLLVDNDDALSKRGNKLLDWSLPLFSILGLEVLDTSLGEVEKVSGGSLNRKQDTNGKKVEHIVDSGSSESTLELVTISHVSHGDDSVGDRSTNIGTHNHKDSLLDRDSVGSDKGDNNGGGGGRGLKKDGGNNTNHQSGNGVHVITEKSTGGASSHNLGTASEKVQTKKEEVKEKETSKESQKGHSPFGRALDTASCANFPLVEED